MTRTFALFFSALSLSLFLIASALAAPKVDHVFIVSIDGGKPSVIQESEMPTLHGLVRSAALTWKAVTVDPNITLPSHTSMLTGVDPETHKITWNNWEPRRGTVKFPTIFARARAAGLKTGLFAGKDKFKHLEVPGSLNVFSITGGSPSIAAAAAEFIIGQKPNLTFIHFPEADSKGHTFGWGSSAQKNALKLIDSALLTVLRAIERAGISSNSVVIITADHGGLGLTHGSRIPANYTIPWIAVGKGIRVGTQLSAGISTVDTAATALWLLDVEANAVEGKPVAEAFAGLH